MTNLLNGIKNERGIALLITLAVISVLMVVALELNRKSRSTITTAAAARNRFTLSQMAASGVQGAMGILIEDKINDPPSGLDTIQENWADPETLSALAQAISYDNGAVEIQITDELSKIQVNTMVKFPGGIEPNNPQMFFWDRFVRLVELTDTDLPEVEPKTIINSIKDWLDSGDDDAITGLNGAESDYYMGLDPPYECKNGPISHLDELILVKGISPELFYGLEGQFGISAYATVTMGPLGRNDYFSGKININTAELPVIAALMPEGSEILAPNIIEYREEMVEGTETYLNDLSKLTWYKNAPGCSDITIDEALITGFSDFFKITCNAEMGEMRLTVAAVVQRLKNDKTGKWECKVLSWQQE